jgi:8-oxo-dGTP pyrophosphatase MutT (NUDIX family)
MAAPSFDPEQLPTLKVDGHLPAVPLSALQAGALRQRFEAPPVWSPEIAVEPRFTSREPTAASVLVPLVQRDELTVLLTQRTAHLNDHPGQISFPGGRSELFDVDAVDTALREAEEEIGLARSHVDVIGSLPTYTTGTSFIVTPVIGLVTPGFTLTLDAFEVADVFEVPLSFLMNPANHRWHAFDLDDGRERRFLSIPWDGIDADGQPRRYFVWGATAAMLRNLYRFLVA